MFAIERIRIIKNHLLKENKVSVAKLSELLDVTEVTIRRDLEKLEKEGFPQAYTWWRSPNGLCRGINLG